MWKKIGAALLCAGINFSSVAAAPIAGESAKRKKNAKSPLAIKVVPIGLTQSDVDRIKAEVVKSAAVQKELGGSEYRLISFQHFSKNEKEINSTESKNFRVRFYDYTNDRTIVAEGAIVSPEFARVSEDADKPNPNREELDAAFDLIARSGEFASSAKNGKLRFYAAMPPITVSASGERLINIGIDSVDDSIKDEIVSVSFRRRRVVRYEKLAPPASTARETQCGIADARQPVSGQGVAGQFQLEITQNGTTIWEMLVTRPSASSGLNGSGIELQNVKYRGKSVFKQAHAPVLNVKYAENACGPFLDWQYDEDFFQAPAEAAQNPAPGIRILAPGQIATTSLETGNDFGNFQGVAIYTQDVGFGQEVVMVTEMNASWYRYIMEWRFAADGTIRPRFGFGATQNPCVCLAHYHNVYWRFDFDVVTPNNRIFIAERGRKSPRPVSNERAELRNYATNKNILIQNAGGNEAYRLVPNLTDGRWDAGGSTFGSGDFWFLKRQPNNGELGETLNTAINLTPYLNNESIENQDAVIWYGAHFAHTDGDNSLLDASRDGFVISGSHVVGPDIRPIRW